MESEYDLVVVGSGAAAMVAAMRAREAGWRVAVVDFRPYGGTYALRGCDPKKMLVGGGYIAAEFSDIAARAGAHVVILQPGERMLKGFDTDLVGWLMEKFATPGIEVHTGTKVRSIDEAPTGYTVHIVSDFIAYSFLLISKQQGRCSCPRGKK